MQDPITTTIPAAVAHQPGQEASRGSSQAPTLFEQVLGVFTAPTALFQRLAKTPRWGQALSVMIVSGWFMMTFWGLKVDVDSLQRPILEQNAQLSASQIEQAIAVSSRFIIPMGIFSVVIRTLFAVLALGMVFWLYSLSTNQPKKPSFLHALSAATVPNLVRVPYLLMISIVAMMRPVGGQIPERLAPSGLAYYLRPDNPKLYALAAQVDPFIIGYFALVYVALRHTMGMKRGDAVACTLLAAVLILGWKVYFWA
jgi:hypothetical protein